MRKVIGAILYIYFLFPTVVVFEGNNISGDHKSDKNPESRSNRAQAGLLFKTEQFRDDSY